MGSMLIAGMVKDDKHRTRALIIPKANPEAGGDGYDEIALKGKAELFHLVGRIQEEAHRFAIEYHRKRRSKGMTE
jgi:excinuclease ABC subunit C